MQTAHEVLVEESTARLRRDVTERKWRELVSRCRAPRWHASFWFQSAMFVLLLAYLRLGDVPGAYRGMTIVTAIYLLVCVPLYVVVRRKRERALLALIEEEAPELYRKLQKEGIA